MPEGPTVDEVLRANGVDGRWLIKIVAKALNDGLERRGAWLPPERLDEAHGYLMLIACQAVVRYDRAYEQSLSTYVYRRVRPRLVDWYRQTLGDKRHQTFAQRHAFLFANRYEDELDSESWDDEYLVEADQDFEAAERELARGLSTEARRGLRLIRADVENGRKVNGGSGSDLARRATQKELAKRLQPARRRLRRPPIRRSTVASIVQKPPLLAIPDVSQRINFSEKTVRRLIARGELPAIRPGGARGRIRVDQDELERWLVQRQTTVRGAA